MSFDGHWSLSLRTRSLNSRLLYIANLDSGAERGEGEVSNNGANSGGAGERSSVELMVHNGKVRIYVQSSLQKIG